MKISSCNNVNDFRELARKNLPSPIFHYIDGAADDEVTCQRNTAAYDDCFLVPRVLRSVETVDLGTKILGKKISLPFFLSPTALQRLFHHEGEMAVAKAAQKFNTFFGISSLSTIPIEEIKSISSPKIFQLYFHKDKGLTNSMIAKSETHTTTISKNGCAPRKFNLPVSDRITKIHNHPTKINWNTRAN